MSPNEFQIEFDDEQNERLNELEKKHFESAPKQTTVDDVGKQLEEKIKSILTSELEKAKHMYGNVYPCQCRSSEKSTPGQESESGDGKRQEANNSYEKAPTQSNSSKTQNTYDVGEERHGSEETDNMSKRDEQEISDTNRFIAKSYKFAATSEMEKNQPRSRSCRQFTSVRCGNNNDT